MSETLREWPISGRLEDYNPTVQDVVAVVNEKLILPDDERWNIALGALIMGGSSASVLAEGEPGTGKTRFGNIVMGEDSRVDIVSTDTAETLDGHKRVTDGEFNEGKIPFSEEDVILFLNEISHLRDTGPLHRLWDGKTVSIGGESYDMSNVAYYATTNFADGVRAKKLDGALRSRFGLSILAGDMAADIAPSIQGVDLARDQSEGAEAGLLPPPKVRGEIRDNLQIKYRLTRNAGAYITEVVSNLNTTGLLTPINITDARIGQGWQQTERARRLVDGPSGKESAIKPEDLSKVAALALGSITALSSTGSAEFQERLGKLDRFTPLEKAILVRRIIAGIANKTVIDMGDYGVLDEGRMSQFMDRRSYALTGEADEINGSVIEAVLERASTDKKERQDGSKRTRNWLGRRSS